MKNILFIFPGQGSQYAGMGRDLFDDDESVREIYRRASEVVGYDMAELSFTGPEEKLKLTRHTQPVLLTHAIACLEAFKQLTDGKVMPMAVAGHSLGEYSALVAAGVLTLEQGLELVKKRGELMGELGEGEMEALPLEVDSARPLADKHYCGIAACNLPDQTVVGGMSEDLDRVVADLNEQFPRKRSARLKTEGAFHTYYMVEAAKRFRAVLETAEFNPSEVQVLSNYSGGVHDSDVNGIRSRLFLQLINPVLWHRNLLTSANLGIDTIIEFGGGIGRGETAAEKKPNLEGIVKKTFRRAEKPPTYHSVINLETLENTVTAFLSR